MLTLVKPLVRAVSSGMAADSDEVIGGPLVGIAEVSDLLHVSRQRADQLTRSKGWPEPVNRVAPIDEYTLNAIHLLFEVSGQAITEEQAVMALQDGAQQLPGSSPRFWRLADVLRWANADGRKLSDSNSSTG
jgi:hypothetical protein